MKLLKSCLIIFFCFFFCMAQAQAQQKKEKDLYPGSDCGGKDALSYFKMAGFKNYPPFSWVEMDQEWFKVKKTKKDKYNGFILGFLRDALEDSRIVQVQDVFFDNYQQIQKALLHGKIEMAFIGYYTDESKSGQDYIYPAYFGNPFIVVSRISKKIEVDDISGLKGLKGIIRREEEIEPLIRGVLPTDTKLDVVDGAEAAFRALLSGEADFMITSPYAADAEARRFKIKDKLHFGTKVLRHIKYFIAFSKISPCRKYKSLFAEKFGKRIGDKAEVEKSILESIRLWEEKHKDEPPLEYTPPEGE
ncbi:MAG: transporter substrate-binding domain-containing protein [Alphaproteobacteria bacterium]|nr:transporter substrate-binding domain-containing protein [Alphaproteobacteria bacterium]